MQTFILIINSIKNKSCQVLHKCNTDAWTAKRNILKLIFHLLQLEVTDYFHKLTLSPCLYRRNENSSIQCHYIFLIIRTMS